MLRATCTQKMVLSDAHKTVKCAVMGSSPYLVTCSEVWVTGGAHRVPVCSSPRLSTTLPRYMSARVMHVALSL